MYVSVTVCACENDRALCLLRTNTRSTATDRLDSSALYTAIADLSGEVGSLKKEVQAMRAGIYVHVSIHAHTNFSLTKTQT